jgi:putative oxidoreductase
MFEQANAGEPRNLLTDWFVRGGIAVASVVLGVEKFSAHSMWPQFFQQVGIGQWFRYFTGVVEILGGVLVLIPWTANAGLALLACTMACAALIWIFVVGPPANAIICGALFLALSGFLWTRRSR